MDRAQQDQQARQKFLEESREYFEQMEQVLLGLPDADNITPQLDIAMRAAHSLKGGAGMMGFMSMARVAHRLEDFIKILRARKMQVDTELETLLLQGVDSLKALQRQLSDGLETDEAWMAARVEPVIGQLRDRLGELSEADENRLLCEEEDVDMAVLVFNGGVEEALDAFEDNLDSYHGESLRQALGDQALRLIELGLMGGVDAFVSLCQSVNDQAQTVSLTQLPALKDQALSLWRRSQSLVQLGRQGKLPTQLNFAPDPKLEAVAAVALESEAFEPATRAESLPAAGLDIDFDSAALDALQTELAEAAAHALEPAQPAPPLETTAQPLAPLQPLATDANASLAGLDLADLSQLQAAFDQIDVPVIPEPPISPEQPEPPKKASAADQEAESAVAQPAPAPAPVAKPTTPTARPAMKALRRTGTLRIAAAELDQINDLFSTLILERNAINLRQRQLDQFAVLLQERMQDLEAFNLRLRRWYDRASMETLSPVGALVAAAPMARMPARIQNRRQSAAAAEDFDALEMDQYSELHLMAQEQMETIVKLQEVTADIRLGLQEMGQSTQALNGTTRQLQTRITRTQMRPLADIVNRFPRLIRDLSVQYGKKVKLKIEGETTLFERAALELLADPLTHILRNSFDHGVETAAERAEAGKSAAGLITLRASQLGNRARIIIRDDGRGIDLDKIRDRLRKYNIAAELIARLSKQELLSFIFEPGFSTADQVTELSGRGVGMDVVRTNLNKIGGDIQVDTQSGQGSAFTIDVPLSLSVLRIMLLEQQDMLFAVPVDAVEALIALSPTAVIQLEDGPRLTWQDQRIPLVSLAQHLVFSGAAAFTPPDGAPMIDHAMALIIKHREAFYAVSIRRYWGEQEVAMRPVSSPLPLPIGFVGATILGDGRVVPVVDLAQLVSKPLIVSEQLTSATPDAVSLDQLASTQQAALSAPKTILIVDDSVHLRRYLTVTLERAGYVVEQARDGREAVDKLLSGLPVQAVLCDVEMPRLDGYGVLDEIKTRPEFASLPISMLTSRSGDRHRKLAMNLGASAYFAKPYNEQELLKTLESLIAASTR